MTFTNALSNALSGMNVASTSLQVRSSNIANATTPGYARRDIALTTGHLGGVRVVSIDRNRADLLMAERLSGDADAAFAQVGADAISKLNAILGEPGDSEGLYAAFTRFETALGDLASTPESAPYQQSSVAAAQDLASTLSNLGDEVIATRTEADRAILSTVQDVNNALAALESLNGVAGQSGRAGLSGLPEQQQAAIDTIASALDVNVEWTDRGQVRIRTAEGVQLLGDTARQIEFSSGGIVTMDKLLSDGDLSGLRVDGVDITPGNAQGITSGSLAGQFAVRDEVGVNFGTRIDAVAEELISRFSQSGVDPTLGAGAQGLFVGTTGTPGLATSLAVNAAVDPSQGGEIWRMRDGIGAIAAGPSAGEGVTKGLLSALSDTRSLVVATDTADQLTMGEVLAALTSVVGTEAVRLSATSTAANTAAQDLQDAELAAVGVNTDEELQSLLLIEQAYAANARVVQVVNDMMARLMEI